MNVQMLLTQIIEMSHNEVAPDVALKENALKWLNSAYFELMEVCLPFLKDVLKKEVVLKGKNNVFILPDDFKRIYTVSSNTLEKKVYKNGLKNDGYAYELYQNSDKKMCLRTFNDVDMLCISYVPSFMSLKENALEEDILLPATYHPALIWGSLVWGSLYERGFHTASEIALFQQKWDEAKRETKLALSTQTVMHLKPDVDF